MARSGRDSPDASLLKGVCDHFAAAKKRFERVEREIAAGLVDDEQLRRMYEAAVDAGDHSRADLLLLSKMSLAVTTTWGVWACLDSVPLPCMEEQLRMNLAAKISAPSSG